MPSVALIQDGTEVGRQWFGDVVGHLQRCCERLSDGRYTEYTLRVFTEEDLGFLLDGIQPAEWQCLVFASNSLNSGRIEHLIDNYRSNVEEYIATGGGIVVLHQVLDSLDVLMPSDLAPHIRRRTTPRGNAQAVADDAQDVLLNFPCRVDSDVLRDITDPAQSSGAAVELPSLYFFSLRPELPARLKPILRAGEDVIAARSWEHLRERVVLVTIPLDWYERRTDQGVEVSRLLSNAIYYASAGLPRRLVWREPGNTRNELLLRWLSKDQRTAIHDRPKDGIAHIDQWLLSVVDVLALAPERLEEITTSAVVEQFLLSGGVILTSSPDTSLPASKITALVGRFEQRNLSGRLTAELRAVEGWRSIESAFDIRNIVAAVSFLRSQSPSASDVPPLALRELSDLIPLLKERLSDEQHREDLGSSIALAQTLAHLLGPQGVDDSLVEWMLSAANGRPFPVELHVRALRLVTRRQVDESLLPDLAESFQRHRSQFRSAAPVARVLEFVAMLDQFDLLSRSQQEPITALSQAICQELSRFSLQPGRGWVSVEATSHVALGLVALYKPLPHDLIESRSELAAHTATCAAALTRGRYDYQRSPKGIALLARVIHSLIVIDQSFPLGLQRLASLEWPDTVGDGSGDRAERELTQHLALENERQRAARQTVEDELESLRRERTELGAAVWVGQACATVIPTMGLATATWYVLVSIGWKSVPGLLANLAVLLSIVGTLVAGLYSFLSRRHLLLQSADKVRDWITKKGVSPLAEAGKLKRQ